MEGVEADGGQGVGSHLDPLQGFPVGVNPLQLVMVLPGELEQSQLELCYRMCFLEGQNTFNTGQEHTVVLPGGSEHIQNQARTHRGPSWTVRTESKPGKNTPWSFLEG